VRAREPAGEGKAVGSLYYELIGLDRQASRKNVAKGWWIATVAVVASGTRRRPPEGWACWNRPYGTACALRGGTPARA
jgi:hypothetical protein